MSASTTRFTFYSNRLSPNGLKVSIYLEELKTLDPTLDYKLEMIDISKNTQKEPWFIKMNPNGRIPVLIDHSRGDFAVFESAAILLYLEQHYDKTKRFSFDSEKNPNEYSTMLQWMFFAHGGVGPMQGQAHFFLHLAPEDVPYGKTRYHEETKRLYGVLNIALTGREFLVGPGQGIYSIADLNAVPWIRLHARAGVESLEDWPHLKSWLSRVLARPGAQAAIQSVSV